MGKSAQMFQRNTGGRHKPTRSNLANGGAQTCKARVSGINTKPDKNPTGNPGLGYMMLDLIAWWKRYVCSPLKRVYYTVLKNVSMVRISKLDIQEDLREWLHGAAIKQRVLGRGARQIPGTSRLCVNVETNA